MLKANSRDGSREEVAEAQELLEEYRCRSARGSSHLIQIMPGLGSMGPEKPPRDETPAEEEQDPVSEVIGEYGRWQLLMTFLLSLFSFPCTFHIYSPTFTSAISDFWCARPHVLQNLSLDVWKNYSQPHGPCSIVDVDWSLLSLATIQGQSSHMNKTFVNCEAWEYDHSFSGETIIEEWNLVCDRNYLNSLSEMIFLTGVAVGGIMGGFVSDRFGRKTTLFTMLAFQSIFGLVMAFSKSYEAYLILKIFLGLCSVSVVLSGFVLSVELVGGKWVTVAGVCNFLPLPVSYIIVSGMSLVLPDWRQLQLALSLPGLFLIPLWWVIPESPRWLLNMGRIKDVIPILTQAAKLNNRTIPQSLDKFLMTSTKNSSETVTTPGCSNLFVPPYRKRTYLISICWFAVTISYYGLVLNIGNLGGDLHFTSMILGIVEIPAIVLSIPVLLKAGRKLPICVSMVICGVFCALSVLVQKVLVDSSWASIVCIMVGKFSISAANIMMPTYTAELYPTLIRNLGVGSSQWSAGLALMCIPYLWTMSPIFEGVPLLIIGALSVLGGLVVLFLPETGSISCTRNDKQERQASIVTICNNGSFKAMADRGTT